MSSPKPPRNRRDFRVAIICALPLEAENVQSVFDKCWEDEGKQYDKARGDQNTYSTGVIGRHNVVLAHMPGMGTTSASVVAAGIRSSFPDIQLTLVVGMCGVVPIHAATQEEIVLGDVIISTAVIQYDFGRQYPNGFQRKKDIEDSLGRASLDIRSFVSMLQTRQTRKRLSKTLAMLIHSEDFRKEVPAAKYPGAIRDRLYEPSYIHQHRSGMSCDKCNKYLETCSKDCEDLQCEEDKLIPRKRHCLLERDSGTVLSYTPSIHFGRFGSANAVMKSGIDRDRIADADEVIAFEMEGAGVWDQHPTIVIKAACDYADSHKSKGWQAYAAAMAAACLKALLREWTIPDQPADTSVVTDTPWILPFERNPNFTGRETQLAELEEKLFVAKDHTSKIAIVGLGGVGKTQLVLELLYRTKEKHKDCPIIWIPATNTESLHQGYLFAARQLKIPGCGDKKADVKKLVQDHLSKENTGHWLLVFDNADDINMWTATPKPEHEDVESAQRSFGKPHRLIDYLPKNNRGYIIFTTRDRKTAVKLARQNIVEVPMMSEVVAKELLRRYPVSPNLVNNPQDATALLAELTYLPLAIVQAAAYINENGIALTDYLLLLQEKEEEIIDLLSKDFEDDGRYRDAKNPVAITWLISFEQIQQRDSLAAEYLSFMACIDPKDIPQDLLPPAPSQIRKIDAISTLTAYSFVSRRPADLALDLHRLVHLATRNWLRKEGLLSQWTEKTIIRLEDVFPESDHSNRSIWRMYLPHVRQALESNLIGKIGERRMTLMQRYGRCLYSDGRWDEAEALFTQVLAIEKRMLGADHPDTLTSMAWLTSTYREQGRWEEAEKLQVQVMETSRIKLGADHPRTLTSMAHLALTYRDQGRWEEAEKLQVEVIERRKTKLGADHPDTLGSVNNLALTYSSQGRWGEAEKLQVEVMERRKTKLGADHPDTLGSMNDLASTYMHQGRWEGAEKLQVEVMEMSKTKLGADHPYTLTSMANLASTYMHQGRWEEAEKLQMEVMERRKTKLGADHPRTLTSMANLALTYGDQGRWEDAEKLQVGVMEMSKTKLGADHPHTLTSMNNLASTYMHQGRWEEAKKLQMEVMEMSKTKLGADHPDTLGSMNNLALTYRQQGRWEEAEKLQVQAVEMSKTKLGADHPHTLTSMANLALTYKHQDRWEEAKKLQMEVMEMSKTKLGADHPDTLGSMNNLALTYRQQGRWEEAEKLQVQAVEMSKTKLGVDHPHTLTSMANLALTYKHQDRWEEAEKLQVEAMETSKRVLGAEHPSTLTRMNHLAHTLKHRGHDDKAMELMICCMNLCIKVLGPSHHHTKEVFEALVTWQIARLATGEQGGQGNNRMPGAWID